jgi:hypothetical protein
MYQVKKERITNDQVRKRFYDIPCVKNMIAARLLSFIGKAVRDPHPLRPTKLMLTTCCNNSRKRGRPYTTNKDTIVNCLVLLFERVPEVTIEPESRIHDRLGKRSQQQEILEVAHSMFA